MSVNKVILVGRLGKDPDLKYTAGGSAVANFTLATDRSWKGQDGQSQKETTWHNIVVWGRQAEVIKEYLSKGRQVYIEGRIANRSYDDKEGNKKYISEVVVEQFRFLGDRGDSGGGSRSDAPPSDVPPPPPPADTGDDDDLPF
ncbi:MAG: single-stranded DNA-binding protein [bacterium]